MSIYTQSIESIKFEDILSFLGQGFPESAILDYKQDFPKDLTKSVCAFANTFGGMIIIGVEEDDGKPKAPFNGITKEDGIQERIINTCVDSIYPPIVPEVAITSKENKSFVIIRIPQSLNSPHAIQSNTRAYIRTGNRNSPESLITYEHHEWLKNHREKSVTFRDNLLESARLRQQISLIKFDPLMHAPRIEFFACPIFPHLPITMDPDFSILQAKAFCDNPNIIVFPDKDVRLKPIDYGMYAKLHLSDKLLTAYFEMTQFGSVYINRNLNWYSPNTSRTDIILVARLAGLVAHFFDTVSNIYTYLGYHGFTYAEIHLNNILGVELIPFNSIEILGSKNLTEKSIERTLSIHPTDFSDISQRDLILARVLVSIFWALGTPIDINEMTRILKGVRRK